MSQIHDTGGRQPLGRYFEHIASCLSLLEEQAGLSVSVHMRGTFLWHYPELGDFLSHRVQYCQAIKSSLACSLCCQRCQRMVTAAFSENPEPRYGTCVFGLEEFTLPILQSGTVVGFISVTGYTRDPMRTKSIAEARFRRLGIDSPPDLTAGLAALNTALPDPKTLTALLSPIADLLGFTLIRDKNPPRRLSYTCVFIMEYIELHYESELTAKRLAEAAHCSVSYINHMFKKNVGVSLSRYINEVRVRRAKNLLDDRRSSIKSVAVSVGYSDTNYFSAVFRRITGLTPSEWRRSRGR